MVKKKSKTLEKVQKMRDLEGPTAFRPFENTLYATMPAKLKFPPLQAQVWGVHAGLTQLYIVILPSQNLYPLSF